MATRNEEPKKKITNFFPTSPAPKAEPEEDRIKALSKCLAHVTETSVLLTPDNTPTKAAIRHSITTPTCPRTNRITAQQSPSSPSDTENKTSDSTNHSEDSDDMKCGDKTIAKLSRSQSDSKLDSPQPTRAKVSRSLERNETAQQPPVPKGGKGRMGKRRGRPKKEKEMSTTAGQKSAPSRSKSVPGKKKIESQNHKVTDYFPVRRSSRMCATDIKKMEEKDMIEAILENRETGMKVKEFEGKGRGVVATKAFKRGDFVVEYAGDLTDLSTAKSLEEKYSKKSDVGCYMYYFNFQNKPYCIDATAESGRLGRLLNHSRSTPNCMTRVVDMGDKPALILVAAKTIQKGEELLYDYGDRSKASLEAHPWLAY